MGRDRALPRWTERRRGADGPFAGELIRRGPPGVSLVPRADDGGNGVLLELQAQRRVARRRLRRRISVVPRRGSIREGLRVGAGLEAAPADAPLVRDGVQRGRLHARACVEINQ